MIFKNESPRIRHVGSSQPTGELMIDGGTLSLEKGISSETIMILERLGHNIKYELGGFGGYQAIKDNVYMGASESRKDGHAMATNIIEHIKYILNILIKSY